MVAARTILKQGVAVAEASELSILKEVVTLSLTIVETIEVCSFVLHLEGFPPKLTISPRP